MQENSQQDKFSKKSTPLAGPESIQSGSQKSKEPLIKQKS